MMLEEEVVALRAENAVLRQQLAIAVARLEELEQRQKPSRPDPPSFVKPNRPKAEGPQAPRKKRASEHNRARRREPPTKMERHALDRCPTCQYALRGESVDYSRQVIELAPPPPVEIIEHQVVKRWCPHCERWHSPHLDLHQTVIGEGRIGVRLASLLAYLRTTLRLPIRAIRAYLDTVHGLSLSTGEIAELLHRLQQQVAPAIAELKRDAQASQVIHADETGWRENGQNGYVWLMATGGEHPVRYYLRDASRGQPVLHRLLGLTEGAVPTACLVSDFYAGYNDYAGPQQRCWIHLVRDLHTLKEEHPDHPAVLSWARSVRSLYDDALAWLDTYAQASAAERQRLYEALHLRARAAGYQYARVRDHPCQALAQRLLRHQDELFQFVVRDEVPPDNNLAERAARPLVVMRKISGGTRSAKGTTTRLGLASLLETWRVRGLNPFTACYGLLTGASP
jgi:transposase